MAAVAIEPLAKRLGATKGSAYWHFANRQALLDATLERWERHHTEAVIRRLEAEDGPEQRLRLLLRLTLDESNDTRLELALFAALDVPAVAAAVQRVNQRRLDYLRALFVDAGFSVPAAERRAVLAYSLYLGRGQLLRGSAPPVAVEDERFLDDALRGLLVPERPEVRPTV